jgi:diguanylate cyclase (GGDEF)-like protein
MAVVRHFQFTEPFGDARVEELKLLSWNDRHGELFLMSIPSGPWHDLLVDVVSRELLTVFSYVRAKDAHAATHSIPMDFELGAPGDTPLTRAVALAKIKAICDLHENKPPGGLRLTHFGRVRLSELKQALRTGREREPFGILWDVRHWERDVQIAILEAGEESPLALAYMDMNGLKDINDTHGHDTGDLALKAYFQAVNSVLPDKGQAYRLSGGADEVLVALPNHNEEAAVKFVRLACTKLMTERLRLDDRQALLSIAAGVITTTDPTSSPASLRSTADEEQKRAKLRSREIYPRPSVIAISGKEKLIVIEHGGTEKSSP